MAGEAGTVDQHVEGAVFLDGRGGRANVRDIQWQGRGGPALNAQTGHGVFQLAGPARHHHDVRASFG